MLTSRWNRELGKIDRSNGIPLYLQLIDILTYLIDSQVYKPGEKLPSERELCENYELSRITVRQALNELEREGYIKKQHGKGTFVTKGIFQQNLANLYSFTDEMKKQGKLPKSRVLSFEIIDANERLAEIMQLVQDKKVIKVIRLRLVDSKPLMYETSYLPLYRFSHITKEQLEQTPMYEIFSKDYHTVVTKAIDEFTATVMEKEEALQLSDQKGAPAILVTRFGYDVDTIVEYTKSIVSSSQFHYRVEINLNS